MSSIWTFNAKDGYAEAIVRGYRKCLLTPDDYRKLGAAETLDDLKSALEETNYENFLQDEPSPLAVTTIAAKCRAKLAEDFQYLQSIAQYPLSEFLNYVAAEKMIDNVVSLIQGVSNKKPAEELLTRVDPLGYFPEMRAIATLDVTSGYEDLCRIILLDSPVGAYFDSYFKTKTSQDQRMDNQKFTEHDLEIMRSALKKAWLESFYHYCQNLGGATAKIMGHILKCEADFRVLSVTLNTINTPLGSVARLEDRNSLYPGFGYLYPDGVNKIRKSWNDITVRASLEPYPEYLELYEKCKHYYIKPNDPQEQQELSQKNSSVSLEDVLFAKHVKLCEATFNEQFHYGIFYAWVKLKEQEIRNIIWIADMILMNRKDQIDKILLIFKN